MFFQSTFDAAGTEAISFALAGCPAQQSLCRYELSCSHASDTTNSVTVTLDSRQGPLVLADNDAFSFADKNILTWEATGLLGVTLAAAGVTGDVAYTLSVVEV